MCIEIEVMGIPMSPNDRPNRWSKAEDTKIFRRAVAYKLRQYRPKKPYKRIKVYYTIVRRGGRPFDDDNALSLTKPLTDGIIDAGFVKDDDRRHVTRDFPVAQKVGKERKVIIRIEEQT